MEALSLFLRGYAVLRFTCDEREGKQSGEYICDDPNYGLESLSRSARNQVRQGLKNCVVRAIDFDLLAAEGCVINKSVFQRQGRHGPAFLEQEAHWREYVTRCKSFSDVEPYGAFVEGRLCAFTLIVRVDEYAYTFHPHAEASSLKFRPMNALIFWVTQSLLRRADIKYVSYGLESLVQQADLVKFKLGMGFKAISIGRMVMLNPLARPFFSAPAAALVRKGAPRNGANNLIQDYLVFVDNYRRYVL